jgi:hypothetical protein
LIRLLRQRLPRWLPTTAPIILGQPAAGDQPANKPQAAILIRQVARLRSAAPPHLHSAEALDLILAEARSQEIQALDALRGSTPLTSNGQKLILAHPRPAFRAPSHSPSRSERSWNLAIPA